MTNKEIRDQVVNTLGLQDDTTFSETGFVNQLIFQAVTDILSRCRPNMRVMDLTLQANTAVHDMSQTIISLRDISTVEGKFLDRYSREDVVRMQRQADPESWQAGWNELGGMFGYAYDEPLLFVSPVPSESQVIRAYGVFRPQMMVGDTDSPSAQSFGGLAAEFHPAIVVYCLWKAGEYVEHESSGYGEKWHLQYEGADGNGGEIAKIKRIMSKRATAQASNARALAKNLGVPSSSLSYIGG